MSGIILIALQILLLLLKAHFTRDSDREKALGAIKEAQERLSQVAGALEMKIRYSEVPAENIDHIQDTLDQERKEQS